MRKNILISFCYILLCLSATAQSRKAGRLHIKAIKYKVAKRTEKAYKKMEKSINKSPTTPEGYSELGQWYFEAHEFAKAAEVFKAASSKCHNGGMRFAQAYARSLVYSGNADKALSIIGTYANLRDSAEWNKLQRQALFVKENSRLSCPWPAALNFRINTRDPELYPSMGVDTQSIYYTRRLENQNDDFYMAYKDSCGEWWGAHNLGHPPNTPNQESAQYISADGHYLFITRCEERSDDGFTQGGCDLFMAYRVAYDSPWTIPQPFGFTINSPDYEGQATLSPDTRELFFVSDRKGGYGGYDIYVSRFEDGLWQPPVNLGPAVNTPGNETAPYMNLDNKTLFFTSDGRAGMGGTDLFMCRRKTDGTWTAAQNLGYPINTAYDERSACVALDGKELYFASDRNGPAGNFDIFEAEMPSEVQPGRVTYIAGCVYDSVTKQKLTSASIYICNRYKGDTLYEFKSNRGDASFIITLPLGNTYAIHTGYMGHIPVDDTITLDKQYTQKPLEHNVVMLPSNWEEIRAIQDSLIGTIHFDPNVIEISATDRSELQKILAPWMQHRNYIFSVNGYTDNTGNPMLNEELSTRRASIITKEIMDIMGMDGVTIFSKGWGEINPITTNDTEEGRRTNRRVEIRLRREGV